MNEIYKGVARSSLGTFKDFFSLRAKAYLLSIAELAVRRGYIERADFSETEISEIIRRKQVFNVLGMMLATMYRATRAEGFGENGCFSDLRTAIETAHADTFVTCDKEVFECGALVRDAFPEFPLRVVVPPH